MIEPSGKILGDRLPLDRVATWLFGFLLALGGGAVAAGKPVVALGLILALLGTIVILARPDYITFIVVFLFYSNIVVVGIHYHGVPRIAGPVLPLLLLIPIFRYLVLGRGKVIVTPPVLLLLFLWLGINVLGVLFSRDVGVSTEAVIELALEGIAVFFLVINSIRTLEILQCATWALLLAGAVICIVPLHQQLTQNFKSDYGGFGQKSAKAFYMGLQGKRAVQGQFRLSGTIRGKNRFAQNLLMLIPIGFFQIVYARTRARMILALLCTSLIGVGCAVTFSRGAIVAFLIMVALMVFMRIIQPRQLLVLALGALLILATMPHLLTRVMTVEKIAALFSDSVSQHEEPDGAIKGRATEMLAAVLVYLDYPVLGVGPGMFKYYSQEYGNELSIRTLLETREAHSLYLDIAANTGTVGLLCFMTIMGVTMYQLLRARRRWLVTRPDLAGLATGYLLALVSYLSTGLFLHMSFLRFFYFILGISAAAAYILNSPGVVESTTAQGNPIRSRLEAPR